jgi:hypothetical protein
MAFDFLQDPSQSPDAACAAQMHPRFFVEPLAKRLLLPEPPMGRLLLLLVTILMMTSGVVTLLLALRRRPGASGLSSRTARQGLWLLAAAAGMNLLLVAVFAGATILFGVLELLYDAPFLLQLSMLLPIASLIPLFAGLGFAWVAWRRGALNRGATWYAGLLGASIVLFLWQANWWSPQLGF